MDAAGLHGMKTSHWQHGTAPLRSLHNVALLEDISSKRRNVACGHEVGRTTYNQGIRDHTEFLAEAAKGSYGDWLLESQLKTSPTQVHETPSTLEAMQVVVGELQIAHDEYKAANYLAEQMVSQKMAPEIAAKAIASIQKAAEKVKDVQGHMRQLAAPVITSPSSEVKRYSDSFYKYDKPDVEVVTLRHMSDLSEDSLQSADTMVTDAPVQTPTFEPVHTQNHPTDFDERNTPYPVQHTAARWQRPNEWCSQTPSPQRVSSPTSLPLRSVKSPTQANSPRWASKPESLSPAAASELSQQRVDSKRNRRIWRYPNNNNTVHASSSVKPALTMCSQVNLYQRSHEDKIVTANQKKGPPRKRSTAKLPNWDKAVDFAQIAMPDHRNAVSGAKAWSPQLLQPTAAYFGHTEVLSKSTRAKERCWSCKYVMHYMMHPELSVFCAVLILLPYDASSAGPTCATLAILLSILRYAPNQPRQTANPPAA